MPRQPANPANPGASWNQRKWHRQYGLTLVELMVALVVGLMLLAGVLQLFVAQQQTFRTHEALAQLQERGRIALELMGREIRRADYWGCLRGPDQIVSVLNTASPEYDATIHSASAGLAADTNKLVLQSLQEISGGLRVKNVSSESASIQVAAGNGIEQHDLVVVSDCDQGTLFQVTNANPGTSGTLVHNTGAVKEGPGNQHKVQQDGQTASVFRIQTQVFQVDESEPLGTRALENRTGMDLVFGVERMQLLYGEDTDGDGGVNRYVSWGTAGLDLERVLSIRVSLLLYTDDNLSPAPLAYRFAGVHYNGGSGPGEGALPSDRRLRKSFTATFAIRNRLG